MKKQKSLLTTFLAALALIILSVNIYAEATEEERESRKCNGGGIKCPPYKYKTMKW